MIILCFIFLILLTLFPHITANSVSESIDLCLKSVIPALFPFLIASNMLLNLKKADNPFNLLLAEVLNISPSSSWAYILGIICGYPIGGKITLELYEKNKISKEEKDRLLVFANNSGPGFIIGIIGGVLLKNPRIGFIIYISHVFSSLIYAILTSFFYTKKKITTDQSYLDYPFFKNLAISIKSGMEAVIGITGVICFFGAVIALLDLIPFISSFKYKGFIYGLIEMTNGIKLLSLSPLSLRLKSSLISFLVTFSGMSVFMQLKTFSDKINKASYFFGKMLCGVISFIITFFLI